MIRLPGIAFACVLAGAGFATRAAASEPVSELLPVPEPAVGAMEAPDRALLEETRSRLDRLIEEGGPPAALAEAFGEVGSLYLLHDFVDPAEAALSNAISLAPREHRWRYYRGVLREREGRLDGAIADYRRVLGLVPDDRAAALRLGRTLRAAGSLEEAEEIFHRVLADDPGNAGALAGLGRIALARGDHELAIDRLEAALAAQPRATSLHHSLGLAHRALGRTEEAKEHLARNTHGHVQISDPLIERLDRLVRGARGLVKVATEAVEKGELALALALCRRAAEIDPDDPLVQYNLGWVLLQSGDRDEGLDRLRRALELDPEYRDAHFNLAVALAEVDRWDAAAEHFGAAARIDPLDFDARLRWAVASRRSGDPDLARRQLDSILEEAPPTAIEVRGRAMVELAELSLDAGRPAAAVEHLVAAVELLPDATELRLRLGGLLARTGRLGEAAEAYAEVASRDPEWIEAHFGRAMVSLLADDEEAALAALEEGLAAVPDAIPLQHALARLLAAASGEEIRDGERAIRLARKVFETEPSVDHAETMAMALAEAGRYREAASLQARIVSGLEDRAPPRRVEASRRRLEAYEEGRAVRRPWAEDRDGG